MEMRTSNVIRRGQPGSQIGDTSNPADGHLRTMGVAAAFGPRTYSTVMENPTTARISVSEAKSSFSII